MTAYPDTSFLCSLYRKQEHTPAAIAWRSDNPTPLLVTQLLQFEFLQSIRLQVWLHAQDKRKGYAQAEADQMLNDWMADIAAGVVEIIACDTELVLTMAERLSSQHTAKTGNRTLDILHVATAVHLRATDFLTFDPRQGRLARAAGLRTPL
jgi:predicted nucleic acid-binding protein